MYFDKEAFIAVVKEEVAKNGEWYIDWGICTDIYKNCPTQSVADYVARRLQRDGYNVFLNRCGSGTHLPAGTVTCYRVFERSQYPNRQMDEF